MKFNPPVDVPIRIWPQCDGTVYAKAEWREGAVVKFITREAKTPAEAKNRLLQALQAWRDK